MKNPYILPVQVFGPAAVTSLTLAYIGHVEGAHFSHVVASFVGLVFVACLALYSKNIEAELNASMRRVSPFSNTFGVTLIVGLSAYFDVASIMFWVAVAICGVSFLISASMMLSSPPVEQTK